MNRRLFLNSLLCGAAGSSVLTKLQIFAAGRMKKKLSTIGMQLYMVRRELEKDFEGTLARVAGLGGVNGFPGNAGGVQVPKPVSDTTQNFGVNGEYVGTSLWGQRYVFKAGYKGSLYTDDYSSYTVQSPYCTGITCNTDTNQNTGGIGTLSPFARLSLPPNNQANAVNATLAADLGANR